MNIEQPEQLLEYLRSSGRIGVDERVRIRNLHGGVSNRTVYVERPNGEQWVLKQALEKLRVPIEWTCSPERIYREALGLRWLEKIVPARVPGFVFEDREHYLLAMYAVPEPHENWKVMLLDGRLRFDHIDAFARLLADIHDDGYHHREEVAGDLGDLSFFEALRLEPYYTFTAREVERASAFLHDLIERTRRRRLTLVHGDYSPKNILITDQNLVLLDHEVIHVGDPAFDLGFSMTHLLSKAHHVRSRRSGFVDAAKRYWNRYYEAVREAEWSRQLESHAVAHTLGCLLARVAGKSRLEYMSDLERKRQQTSVLELIENRPTTMPDLIERFHHEIDSRE